MVGRGAGQGIGTDISPGMIDRAREAAEGDARFRFEVAEL